MLVDTLGGTQAAGEIFHVGPKFHTADTEIWHKSYIPVCALGWSNEVSLSSFIVTLELLLKLSTFCLKRLQLLLQHENVVT